jgi:hypothetical protein
VSAERVRGCGQLWNRALGCDGSGRDEMSKTRKGKESIVEESAGSQRVITAGDSWDAEVGLSRKPRYWASLRPFRAHKIRI